MVRTFPLLALLAGCPAGKIAPDGAPPIEDTTVTYRGRSIDLAPFLVGYPHTPVVPLWEEGRLLLDHQGATRTLRSVAATFDGAPPDPDRAEPLTDIDWDSRNRWSLQVHEPSRTLWWTGDANNNERLNLWRMSVDGGEPERVTDVPYVYGWSFDPEDRQIAWIPRRGEGPYRSCLYVRGIADSVDREVACDTPAASFTWTRPSWAPDGRGVLIRVNLEGQRSRGNLAWVPLDTGEVRVLTDPGKRRRTAFALERWLDANTALVVVDDDDQERLARLDVNTGALETIYATDKELRHVGTLAPDGTLRAILVEHDPVEDVVLLVDPTSGDVLARESIAGSASWLGDDESDRALLSITSAATPFATAILDVGPDSLSTRPWLALPQAVADEIVHCNVERVSVPTWDADPETGETRQLHAFLYTPREGPPRAEQVARITAFYGGGNTFQIDTQIHCAAGITTLSPAVRGSSGFGPAFAALNDGDLGGDEIVDVFAAARWLVSQGWSQDRIGVYGGSHGGYATMRALTFPEGTNGHGADRLFPLAFGVSRAGFSDIVTFWETCNIPDWVLLEAGDPETEADALRDRSPLHHADLLKAPLLMVHGENDSRVPVRESRQMAAACEAAGAPCTYVEFPGMGHHIKGVANQRRVYQATFDLLGSIGEPAP